MYEIVGGTRLICVGMVVLAVLGMRPAVLFATNGLETIGVGQNAISRGGSDAAVGDTAFSQVLNPATLSFRLKRELVVGGQCILPRVHFNNVLNDDESQIEHIEIPCFSLAVPVDDKWSWGVSVHGRAGLATDFKLRYLYPPLLKHKHTSYLTVPGIGLNAAYKINDQWAVGAGVRTEIMFVRFNAALGPGNLQFDKATGFGLGFQVGVSYRPAERLTLGAAYHSPTWFNDVRSDKLVAELFPLCLPLGKGSIDQPTLPQKIILGASYEITDRWRVMGEARWVNYRNSFLHDGVIAADLAGLRVPLNHKYKDAWIFMVGTEYKLNEQWTVSAGYNYGTNPTRGTHLLPGTTAGITEHHMTMGLRYDNGTWFAGLGWVYALRNRVDGDGIGSLPVEAFPISWDYGEGSSVRHSQNSIVFSMGFRF